MCTPLFDELPEVEERLKHAHHVMLCVSYDGALTDFTTTPLETRLSPQMDRVLMSLSEHQALSLVIMSGRDRADLLGRLQLPHVIYAGNHGLEISGPGFLFIEPLAAAHVNSLQDLAERLKSQLASIRGVLVQFKGLTVSVHFRQVVAGDWSKVQRIVQGALAREAYQFILTPGEKVYEIRPCVYWNRGSAVAWITRKLATDDLLPIYIGDDSTDEEAYVRLHEGITVKVGDASDTNAQYSLEGPKDVRRFLEFIDEWVRQKEFHGELTPLVSEAAS